MMRMIMKNKKRRADKKGVILVTVLFILALAMIFISCALLLTSATRSRVYDRAEKTQARLTLTSAVETFYQAVQMQEIDDAHLIEVAKATSDDETKDWIDLNMSTVNQVPGMRNTKDSKTQVRLVYKAGEQKVYATFRTQVGDAQTEYAQLVLKEGEDEKYPDLFAAQVDYIGDAGNNFRASIGAGAPSGASDNFIVYRGNYRSNQSEHTTAYSDMLFLGKKNTPNVAYFENNEHMRGNLIFMDDYYYSWSSTCPDLKGNVYFLGAKGGKDVAFTTQKVKDNGGLEGGQDFSATRTYAQSSQTWIFVNRKFSDSSSNTGPQFSGIKNANPAIFLSASAYAGKPSSTKLKDTGNWDESLYSNIKGAGSTTFDGWKNNYNSDNAALKSASMYYTTDRSYLVKDYPTSSAMYSDYGIPRTSAEASSKGFTSKTLSDIVNEQHALNTTGKAKPITSSDGVSPLKLIIGGGTVTGVSKVNSATAPKVVFLDGNIDTYLFVSDHLNLYNVIFAVVGANDKHHQYFILAQGKNLKLSEDDKWDSGGLIGTGFLSIPRGYSAQQYYNAITGGTFKMSNSASTFGHNGVNKPTMNIYGMGGNQIEVKKGTIIEGYVGLFEANYSSISSTLTITNITSSALFRFYGRLMATVVKNTSGDFDMPYCPGPGSKVTEDWPEYKSKYRALSVKYFYNSEDTGD